jgi:hypothetical protein
MSLQHHTEIRLARKLAGFFKHLPLLYQNEWTKTISGRLESRIRYTPAFYNNFPFPLELTEKPTEWFTYLNYTKNTPLTCLLKKNRRKK